MFKATELKVSQRDRHRLQVQKMEMTIRKGRWRKAREDVERLELEVQEESENK